MQDRTRIRFLVAVVTALVGAGLVVVIAVLPRVALGRQAAEPASAGTPAAEHAPVVSEDDVRRYVEVRRFAQEQDPGLATLLRSPAVEDDRSRLAPALDVTGMAFDRFAEIHRFVLANPDLHARVEAQLARTGVGPATGEPSTSGAAAPGGAAPSASPR